MSIDLVVDFLLIVFCSTTIVTDWTRQRIFNWTTYPAMVIGLLLAALVAFPGDIGGRGFLDHLVATLVVFAITLPLTYGRLHGLALMKAGDAKFLMAIGALNGSGFLFAAFLWGGLIGGVAAIGSVVASLMRGKSLGEGLRSYMPYGVSLAIGTLVALLLGAGS